MRCSSRRWRRLLGQQIEPVEASRFTDSHADFRCVDRHPFDDELSTEQIRYSRLDIELPQGQQGLPGGLRHLQVFDRSRPGEQQLRLLALFLPKNEGQIGIHGTGFHLHRQFDRRIVEILRQLDIIQRQHELAVHRFGERFALAFDFKGRPVDGCREMRFDEGFRGVGHAREERQGQGDIADDVLLVNETIVKLDLPAGNLDVIQRKRRGRPGLCRLGRLSR